MPRIQDIGAFSAVREAGLAKLVPAVPRIAVGMGTCGRGNGAEGLYSAFAQAIELNGADLVLALVGCFGACFLRNGCHSAFLYHYARLIEIVCSLERIEALLADPQILDSHVRASAGVNALEGVGMIEAPRGTLIHHYKVNEEGAITWANLIVATGHNNLAIVRSVRQVSEHFIDATKLNEGMLNRVSAVVRAYDPCLCCSTHASGLLAMRIQLIDPEGTVVDELAIE